jgi:hypothetical protein
MNLRAKCTNEACKAFNIDRSVAVGQLTGFGAPNDRVTCPACGELMTTTKSINVSVIGRASKRATSRRTRGRSR